MTTPPTTKTPLTDNYRRAANQLNASEAVEMLLRQLSQIELKNQELEAEVERLKQDSYELVSYQNGYKDLEQERDALKLAGDEFIRGWNLYKVFPSLANERIITEAIQSLTTTKKENEG